MLWWREEEHWELDITLVESPTRTCGMSVVILNPRFKHNIRCMFCLQSDQNRDVFSFCPKSCGRSDKHMDFLCICREGGSAASGMEIETSDSLFLLLLMPYPNLELSDVVIHVWSTWLCPSPEFQSGNIHWYQISDSWVSLAHGWRPIGKFSRGIWSPAEHSTL